MQKKTGSPFLASQDALEVMRVRIPIEDFTDATLMTTMTMMTMMTMNTMMMTMMMNMMMTMISLNFSIQIFIGTFVCVKFLMPIYSDIRMCSFLI